MSVTQTRGYMRRVRLMPRRRAQRGQALIEFTFLLTFVMMPLVVGVTDIAALLNDNVRIVYAAREGARTGAVLGMGATASSPDPDCAIVGAINASLLNQNDITVTQVTIFEVNHSGTRTGFQDVYPGGDVCNSSGTFNPAANPDTWPGLPPAAPPNPAPGTAVRNTTPFNEDSIGIRVDFTYTWRFNVLGFAPFSGYDEVQYPMNPAGEPTPLPAATPTTCGGGVLGGAQVNQPPQGGAQALPTIIVSVTPCV